MEKIAKLSKKELAKIRNSRKVRRLLAKSSHFWFFCLYLGHYMTYGFAPFHYDMFRLTEDELLNFIVLVAFRGSAKSTLVTMSYVIWSIIGRQQKKFILIVSQTQAQAKMHLTSIKRELESNELLKDDIGPFQEVKDEWGSYSLVIKKYGARITAVSTEQSIRGIRHGKYRPDLVICDDIEDINSVRTKDGRNKTQTWFNAEIIPVGDNNTRTIVIGNLLHEDSLVMRLKNQIENGDLGGSFISIPLLGEGGNIAWLSKYPTMKDVENQKSKFTQESAFIREYLLRIVSDGDQLIEKEWLHYYREIPSVNSSDFKYAITGIDLAISQKESADYTAMVSAYVFGNGNNLRIHILPNPINERMNFPQTVETAINVSKTIIPGKISKLLIENVGYQEALVQHLISKGYFAEGVSVKGQDKRSRLALITHLIKSGIILFPEKGVDDLIMQLTGFETEKYNDLADAFSLLILWIAGENCKPNSNPIMVKLSRPIRPSIRLHNHF